MPASSSLPAGRARASSRSTRERYATLMIDEYLPPGPEAIEAALARLEQEKRPFISIYRLRALGALDKAPAKPLLSPNPGGDGAAGTLLLNTDRVLAAVESKLKERSLFDTTNIVVVAEHGRSTVWEAEQNELHRRDEVQQRCRPRICRRDFSAIDLIKALLQEDGGLSLYDPDQKGERVHWWQGHYPSSGNATIAVQQRQAARQDRARAAAMTSFTCRKKWTRRMSSASGAPSSSGCPCRTM